MSEKKTIEIDGLYYSYTLHIKKMKNIILKVESDGEIIVSANAYIPQKKIDAFITEKLLWILKMQEKKQKQASIVYDSCLTQDYFHLFGQRYQLLCIQSNKNDVSMDATSIYVYYKQEREDCLKTMRKFIRQLCEREFTKIVDVYYEMLKDYDFSYPSIKYRDMKTRWGSCATNREQITLNTKMIHYPKAFVEYVVLHELVHFVQPNHSKHFYRIIEHHMPDYKERIKLSVL